ncbi:aldo/keto reductase [Segniliparus rugosus]|uniref:NADP-dependent oxidoreductase domain-containing protein n=1 Tax=Segniliparus rugosus (strain ATCC BAA-974 / DSM 45345 / CCUG 50838 / CIP 108380 / JCM 13579 / CDC 945) TaxID=679197 RepID=E5XU83_SEGRC|nr:aldo/keto reductase [Segniliparus rugosus]EFV12082.1 hypothetical protein HMPREF9336_03055 [Segniliparus rugosus ATCC BAA-974]
MATRRHALQLGAVLAATSAISTACAKGGIPDSGNGAAKSAPAPSTRGQFRLRHALGLGGVAIGDGMNVHSDEDCRATLEEAWNSGIRYYDTSPFYGYGLSERRFGNFLYNVPREEFVLSTKVGRLFTADARFQGRDSTWKGKANFSYRYDFSGPGVRRSVEDSLNRLGLPYIDIVYVHDLDSANPDIDWSRRFDECARGAFPELSKMRDEGLIKGWGLGVNNVEPIMRAIRESDPDICMCAEQYSLIEHENALRNLFPLAQEKDVQLVMVGALNGGYLAGTPRYAYQESKATPQIAQKREALRAVAARHDVDLRTAAIQFALAPSVVASVPVGMHTADQVRENVASFRTRVADDFWSELKQANLILQDAPTAPRDLAL